MASRLTPWFRGVLPHRAGIYKIRWYSEWYSQRETHLAFCYWSRRLGWRQACGTVKEASRRNHYPHHAFNNNPMFKPDWRGLAADPALPITNTEAARHEDDTDNWW